MWCAEGTLFSSYFAMQPLAREVPTGQDLPQTTLYLHVQSPSPYFMAYIKRSAEDTISQFACPAGEFSLVTVCRLMVSFYQGIPASLGCFRKAKNNQKTEAELRGTPQQDSTT